MLPVFETDLLFDCPKGKKHAAERFDPIIRSNDAVAFLDQTLNDAGSRKRLGSRRSVGFDQTSYTQLDASEISRDDNETIRHLLSENRAQYRFPRSSGGFSVIRKILLESFISYSVCPAIMRRLPVKIANFSQFSPDYIFGSADPNVS